MRKIFSLSLLLFGFFFVHSQALYVPSAGAVDSIKHVLNVSNTVRTVYNRDLLINHLRLSKYVTDSATLRGLINTNITAIAGRVPSTRSISINGTAFDLSQDRAWTISAGTVTGKLSGDSITRGTTYTALKISDSTSFATKASTTSPTFAGLTATGTVVLPSSTMVGGVSPKLANDSAGITGYVSGGKHRTDSLNTKNLIDAKQANLQIINAATMGAVGDSSTNNSSVLQGLISSNKTIFLPKGVYKLSSGLDLSKYNKLKIYGEAGTKIVYNGGTGYGPYSIFLIHDTINNIEISNIDFQVTATDAAQNTAIIQFNSNLTGGLVLKGFSIHDCTFTAPNVNINAIGVISEGTGKIFENVVFERNRFVNLGRMGIEIVNNNFSDFGVRYRNVSFIDNYFENTGISGSFGCGISCSGEGENLTMERNRFYNLQKNHGIEISTGSNIQIINNKMWGSTNFNGISGDCQPATLAHLDGLVVSGNSINITGATSWGFNISNAIAASITGNTISTGVQSELHDCVNTVLTGNTIKSKSYFAFLLATDSVGKGTKGTIAQNNLFDNSATATINYGTVLFTGAYTTDNKVVNNRVLSPTGATLYDQTVSATGNTFWTIGTTDFSTALQASQVQNLLLRSEDLSNAAWDAYTSGATITNTNGAADLTSVSSLNTVTITAAGANLIRQPVTVTPSTVYTFSFEVRRGTATDLTLSVYDATHSADIVGITSYYNLTSSSKTIRVSIRFTTPAGCTSINVYPLRDGPTTGTVFVGRLMLNEGGAPSLYAKTTSAAVYSLPAPVNAIGTMTQIVASNVVLANTGSTTNNTVFTYTIPANSIGLNGSFHMTLLASAAANNANAKTIQVQFNGTTVAQMVVTSTLNVQKYWTISNRNSASSQVAFTVASGAAGAFGSAAFAPTTFTINTAADITLTIKVQNANASDTTNIEAFQLWTVN